MPDEDERDELRIELQMDDAADEQERVSDTAKLRRRLLDLDVHDVKLASAGPPPDGARAAGVMEIGALIVALGECGRPTEIRTAGSPSMSSMTTSLTVCARRLRIRHPANGASCRATPFGVSGVVAIVLGVRARKEITTDPDKTGSGQALAGIVLGAIGILIILIIALA